MSESTQIILAVIGGVVTLGGLMLKQNRTQRSQSASGIAAVNEVGDKVGKVHERLEQFDILLSGYKGVGGLLSDVDRLKRRDESVDARIADSRHMVRNELTATVANMELELTRRIEATENRIMDRLSRLEQQIAGGNQ